MQILLNSKRFDSCYYQKLGTGFPIFLLHGFGEDGSIFKYQIEFLKQFYTVIIPDFPGSGASDLPNEPISMELLADFVHDIAVQEAFEKILLIGHSMGGYATLSYVEKYPSTVRAYGLLHSSAYADDDLKKENRRKSIKLIQNEGKEVFLQAMVPNLYSEQSREQLSKEVAFHLTMALEISSDTLIAYYQAMMERTDKAQVLKDNKIPVLFVIGKEDNAINYKDMLMQSTLPEISSIEMLIDIGHTSMLECPQKLNSILNNFCIYVFDNKIA
jgi:pimeloyl-ACP methyl ester carboxylesterase